MHPYPISTSAEQSLQVSEPFLGEASSDLAPITLSVALVSGLHNLYRLFSLAKHVAAAYKTVCFGSTLLATPLACYLLPSSKDMHILSLGNRSVA